MFVALFKGQRLLVWNTQFLSEIQDFMYNTGRVATLMPTQQYKIFKSHKKEEEKDVEKLQCL